MAYELVSYVYKRKSCWTILDSEISTSPLYAIIYSGLNLRLKAPNTQRIHASALAMYYQYIKLKHAATVEKYVRDNGWWALITQVDEFLTYLEADRKGIDIISLHGGNNDGGTNNSIISCVLQFLSYTNARYITPKYEPGQSLGELRRSFNTNSFLIRSKRKELTREASDKDENALRDDFKSFTPHQIQAFTQVIQPHTPKIRNPLNPFRDVENSFRNYLISILLLEYGLRRGEVCLLDGCSFGLNKTESTAYITITNTSDENSAVAEEGDFAPILGDKASIKTKESHRTIKINMNHYQELELYVQRLRPKCDTDALFVAHQQRPKDRKRLSLRMINKIFEKGYTKSLHTHFPDTADPKSPEYLKSVHPHKGRHTWAVAQLAFLVQEKKKTLEEAKDLLRVLGGWKINSPMPDHYGRRYLADSANALNLQRINLQHTENGQ